MSGAVPRTARRVRAVRRATAVVLLAALVVTACAGNDSAGAGAGDDGDRSAAPAQAVAAPRHCDGATTENLRVEPVEGVPSDHTLTSFDGAEIRMHWFPGEGAGSDEPAPTVLMGPGWSLPGDTSLEGAPVFGALGIGPMNEAGYNVLTWDPRGFGESTGSAQVNDPHAEGRDAQLLLDWVAQRPEAMTDAEGDPRVGMVGFSYGGGIQLTLAGIDCRVDAIAPGLAWHSLETSLYKAETVKTGWAGVLVNAAMSGTVAPQVVTGYDSGVVTGSLSDEEEEWFLARGPAGLVEEIDVPTLLIQGTVDTLFTLDEAITNHEVLRDADVPVAMVWFCGGHGSCLTEAGDEGLVGERTFAWLDRHLKGDASVDTGPGFQFVDQDGRIWSAPQYPPAAGEPMRASGGGTLELREDGGAELTEPLQGFGPLDSLVWDITPGLAQHAVEVDVDGPTEDALVLGAPELRLTYRGSVERGERPTRVFAQLVDDDRAVVVGNQITPIPLQLDGETHTVEVDLEVVVQHLAAGSTLTLQLVATTSAYATPRLGGEVRFEEIELTLPTVTGATRQDGA